MTTPRYHGSKISGSQQSVVLQMWQKKTKIDMYDFSSHDCSQEQNDSPYLSFHRSTMQVAISGQERLLRFRNFGTIVTLHRTSPF